jgi:ABC-type transporter Mla maintaining outer membrane lipid asymmetry ATPase subunit MlaF
MSQAGETVISVKDLKMGYGDKVLMERLNFDVKRGEVFVILGGSGCGKSTLLKHMIGLFPPMAGGVWFGEENLVTAQGDERVKILRKFGVMYQSGALFGSMTVLENVQLPLDEFPFVVVTHELPSIYTIADRVIRLDGKTKSIIGEGSPEELRDHSPNPWVRRFFNREADEPKEPAAAAKT